MGIDCKPNVTDMDMPFTGYFVGESQMIKQLTEFKNRKVVHQELYHDRLIIVVKQLANRMMGYSECYTTYICNKRFDVLSDDTHSTESVDLNNCVAIAKATIERYI